jgi:hypothetical protein
MEPCQGFVTGSNPVRHSGCLNPIQDGQQTGRKACPSAPDRVLTSINSESSASRKVCELVSSLFAKQIRVKALVSSNLTPSAALWLGTVFWLVS